MRARLCASSPGSVLCCKRAQGALGEIPWVKAFCPCERVFRRDMPVEIPALQARAAFAVLLCARDEQWAC
jgi:hypothetical protein